jgi:predicted ferric reductase
MNIGTFLAFGIDYQSLERIYLSIIYYVLIIAMLSGLLVSFILGWIGSIRWGLLILRITLEENETYFKQFSEWTFILLGIVLIISYLSIKQITYRIFRQTPGDLLYDRT